MRVCACVRVRDASFLFPGRVWETSFVSIKQSYIQNFNLHSHQLFEGFAEQQLYNLTASVDIYTPVYNTLIIDTKWNHEVDKMWALHLSLCSQ